MMWREIPGTGGRRDTFVDLHKTMYLRPALLVRHLDQHELCIISIWPLQLGPLADNEAQACHFIISHQYSVIGIRECIYGTTISALNPGHRLSVVEHKFSLSHSFFIEYANLRIFVIKVEKLVITMRLKRAL